MIFEILLFIPLLLDGIILNNISYNSFFIPALTITTIYIIYPLYKKKERLYFISIVALGILYALLHTDLLFFNAILFFIIAIISKYIYKNYTITIYNQIIYISAIIICYEILFAVILFVYRIVPVSFPKIIYKISHSLLLNLIYGEILYLLIPKKQKR